MTAVVALLAHERGGPNLAFQVMLFPATDFRLNTPSMQEFGEEIMPTREEMLWIRKHYLPNEANVTNPLASPLLAPDLSGMPSALIITAEYDPLRDEGEAFGKRLQEAGIPAKVSRYAGMIHDFPDSFEEPGNQAVDEIAAALRAAFNCVQSRCSACSRATALWQPQPHVCTLSLHAAFNPSLFSSTLKK